MTTTIRIVLCLSLATFLGCIAATCAAEPLVIKRLPGATSQNPANPLAPSAGAPVRRAITNADLDRAGVFNPPPQTPGTGPVKRLPESFPNLPPNKTPFLRLTGLSVTHYGQTGYVAGQCAVEDQGWGNSAGGESLEVLWRPKGQLAYHSLGVVLLPALKPKQHYPLPIASLFLKARGMYGKAIGPGDHIEVVLRRNDGQPPLMLRSLVLPFDYGAK